MSRVDRSSGFPALDWGGSSRRRFIQGLAAFGALAGAGLATSGCGRSSDLGDDSRPLLALSAGEARTLEAAAEAIVPPQAGFPSVAEAQVLRRFDEELSFVAPSIRDDIKAALGVLEYAPALYGRMSRFPALDLARRRAVLAQLCDSRLETLRAIGSNVEILVRFFYFAHPSTWSAMGYDGPFGRMPEQASEQRRWYAQQTGARS